MTPFVLFELYSLVWKKAASGQVYQSAVSLYNRQKEGPLKEKTYGFWMLSHGECVSSPGKDFQRALPSLPLRATSAFQKH